MLYKLHYDYLTFIKIINGKEKLKLKLNCQCTSHKWNIALNTSE